MKRIIHKTFILFGLLLLSLLLLVFSQSNAFLQWISETPLDNVFTINKPEVDIEEKFDGEVKKDIRIKNSGQLSTYVRVRLIPQWQSEDGKVQYLDDFNFDFRLDEEWIQIGADYYYKKVLKPGEITSDLLNNGEIKSPHKEGKKLIVDVIVQSIQATPMDKVEEFWNVLIDPDTLEIKGGKHA